MDFGDHFVDWLWMAMGVMIAIVLPVLTAFVRSQFKATAAVIDFKKYGALLLLSGLTAIVVLAIYRQAEPDTDLTWFGALLGGYAWEATLEKFTTA